MSTPRRPMRRSFAKTAAATASLTVLGAAARGQGRTLTAGLIGCGGRGSGAAKQFIEAGTFLKLNARLTAVADAYPDRASRVAGQHKIPRNRVFVGFDAYRKLLDSGVDVVLLATPPNFRPGHLEAAIQAGKHVFMEKPVAVDPPGARKIMAAGKLAARKGLSIVAGTQRRHQKNYIATARLVADGAIGRIRGGRVSWCQRRLWLSRRRPEWSNREYIIRNWYSFLQTSGDHIIEQHVHNLDVLRWFTGTHPTAATGFGGRARRETGNQFDFFSVDLEFGDGARVHSTCRQIDGCTDWVGEHLVGTKGSTNCCGGIQLRDQSQKLKWPTIPGHDNPYVNEHADLLKSIVDGKPLIEAQNVAEATMAAIMGRISAYTGQRVAWDDCMNPKHKWGGLRVQPTAEDFEKGDVPMPAEEAAPVPGRG